jgi:hypothetical protein
MAWERYMQTEGLSQHVCCQNCDNKEKPIVVVNPGKKEQRRQLVCFCTYCWSFTNKHHSKDANMDISCFKQFNPSTGKFHRALPYAEDEHPRRILGPVTDHELVQFRKDCLQLRKAGVVISGPFIKNLLHNHFITEIFFSKKSVEVKDSVIFLFFLYLTRELNLYTPLVTISHIQNRYQLLQTHPP